MILPGTGAGMGTRARSLRSASPSKSATPVRAIASVRKKRSTMRSTSNNVTANSAVAKTPTSSFLSAVDSATSIADTESRDASVDPDAAPKDDIIHVHIDTTVDRHDDIESTHTKLQIDMPAGLPDLPLPTDPQDMLAQAKELVEAANRMDGRINGVKSLKRKADDFEDDDDDENVLELAERSVKRQKVLEVDLKKERVKTKALIGLSATLTVG